MKRGLESLKKGGLLSFIRLTANITLESHGQLRPLRCFDFDIVSQSLFHNGLWKITFFSWNKTRKTVLCECFKKGLEITFSASLACGNLNQKTSRFKRLSYIFSIHSITTYSFFLLVQSIFQFFSHLSSSPWYFSSAFRALTKNRLWL